MKKTNNIQRYALEWSVLVALILLLSGIITIGSKTDPESYCPFGGLQSLINYVTRGSLPCGMASTQIFAGLALLVAVVLFGKLFCAYICPIGTFSSLLMKLRCHFKIKPLNIRVNGISDKLFRMIKYVLLFFILSITLETSELFCKRLDPYYAVATAFRGEIITWMSIGMLSALVILSILVDNFWCRYLCPLGAISNSCKYWLWMVTICGVVFIVGSFTNKIPANAVIALFCCSGYLLEVFSSKTSLQIFNVYRNSAKCSNCKLCETKCPYHINIASFDYQVNDVDCMLCGECVENCPSKALHIGIRKDGKPNYFNRLLPAFLTVLLTTCAIIFGAKYELPTIDEYWNIETNSIIGGTTKSVSPYSSFTIENLNQVRCYRSSIAFRDKLMRIDGVYGVKTYANRHKAVITYHPAETTPEKIQQELFIPKTFQISVPDYKHTQCLRVITIHVDKMTRSNSINLLGLQFKQLDSLIYGLETEWDTPVIVKMYVDPLFTKDESWIKDVVSKQFIELTNANSGKTTQIETGFEYVSMDKEEGTISTKDFLHRMFKPFKAEFCSNIDHDRDKIFFYEIPEKGVTKPIIQKGLPYLASYLSHQDGIESLYTCLDDSFSPMIVIRCCPPMTEEKIQELLSAKEWVISDKEEFRTIPAQFTLAKGVVKRSSRSLDR